jgi:hypothetical protein
VVAQWLQAELNLNDVEITPTWHAQPLGELLDQRRQPWGTLLVGRICAACNNGWMSDLEVEVQPILTPLVRAERDSAHLTAAERFPRSQACVAWNRLTWSRWRTPTMSPRRKTVD